MEGTCGNKAYPEGILLMALTHGHHRLPTGALMTPADRSIHKCVLYVFLFKNTLFNT